MNSDEMAQEPAEGGEAFGEILLRERAKAPPATYMPLPVLGSPPEFAPLARALGEGRHEMNALEAPGWRPAKAILALYRLADRIAAAVGAAYPESRCKEGCSGCCTYPTAFFLVPPREWEAIRDWTPRHWDEATRQRFATRYRRTHGPHGIALWLAETVMRLPWNLHLRPGALILSCPFLEDNRCSIHPVRPLLCRTYGSFAVRDAWRRDIEAYACRWQADTLDEAFVGGKGRPALPSVNRLHDLRVRHGGGRGRTLARWIRLSWPWTTDGGA
jgi:Fe-S-cluster containining protein